MEQGLLNELNQTKAVFGRGTLLDIYNKHPQAANELFRDPNSAALYWKVQEFNKTSAWNALKKRVAEADIKGTLNCEKRPCR